LADDRERTRGLRLIMTQLELKRYAEVSRLLGELLEDPATTDFFLLPDASGGSRRSFKAELRRLIGNLPPEGRQAYELQFGPRAQRLLDDALAKGDFEQLISVARRYPHAPAGYEAVYLLARNLLEQGQAAESLLWLQQLREMPDGGARYEPLLSLWTATAALQSGQNELARQVLVTLKQKHPRGNPVRCSPMRRELSPGWPK